MVLSHANMEESVPTLMDLFRKLFAATYHVAFTASELLPVNTTKPLATKRPHWVVSDQICAGLTHKSLRRLPRKTKTREAKTKSNQDACAASLSITKFFHFTSSKNSPFKYLPKPSVRMARSFGKTTRRGTFGAWFLIASLHATANLPPA